MAKLHRFKILGALAAFVAIEILPIANAAITYADEREKLLTDTYLAVSDQTAPAIGAARVEAEASGATVRWEDDEATWAWLYYAIPEELASSHAPGSRGTIRTDGSFATSHAVTIDGLVTGVEYRYVIESTDASGNVAVTEMASFRTR